MALTLALRASLLCLIVGTLFAPQALAAPSSFLRKVSMHDVEAQLEATLSTFLRGASAAATRRIELIEKRTWQTFQALPKNAAGRLAPPAVRYIIHEYFAREHGWLIKGLESHGNQLNVTEMHDVNILLDKAPLVVEGLLEARQVDRGLSFNDIVTMASVLEQMMFDESMSLLQTAYRLHGISLEDQIDEAMLHKVLRSYLKLFDSGSNLTLAQSLPHDPTVEEFEHDMVLNYEFARQHRVNPFKPRLYSFQAVSEIMEELAQNYGKWQNEECRDMKAHLAELDAEGLGRVPLGIFYAQPKEGPYHFSESAHYLREIGALDETSPSNPQVIIVNYIAGPSNCIASSPYYSVCCISECAEILAELEHLVAAPAASPERLLTLIGHISDKTLPRGLPEKLEGIAAHHGGEVPLHGRLFAQWLHFAFPLECPYPSVVESSAALTASQWLQGKATASAEEQEQHLASPSSGRISSAEDFDIDGRWSDQEVLPVHERPTSLRAALAFEFVTGAVRLSVQLFAVFAALRAALGAFRSVSGESDKASKKDDDLALGFRV